MAPVGRTIARRAAGRYKQPGNRLRSLDLAAGATGRDTDKWPSSSAAWCRPSASSRWRRRASSISISSASRSIGSIASSRTSPVYMQVSRDGLVFHLSEHHGDGTPGSIAYVYMTGVEDLHRELIGKQVPAQPPRLAEAGLGHAGGAGGRSVQQPHHLRRADRQARRMSASLDARASRSRNRPPRARARDGGRALRQGAGASRRPALAAAEGFRQAHRRHHRHRHGAARQISARRPVVRRRAGDASRHVGLVPRREERRRRARPGRFHHERSKLAAHDHVVFHMSSGAVVSFNDPRRFGSMKLVARARDRSGAAAALARAGAARQRIRCRDAGAARARARRPA